MESLKETGIHFQNISAKVLSLYMFICTLCFSVFLHVFYGHFQIWEKSDDENMELLLDYAVRKVEKLSAIWDEEMFIKMLYEDGTHLGDTKKVSTFYDLVSLHSF